MFVIAIHAKTMELAVLQKIQILHVIVILGFLVHSVKISNNFELRRDKNVIVQSLEAAGNSNYFNGT